MHIPLLKNDAQLKPKKVNHLNLLNNKNHVQKKKLHLKKKLKKKKKHKRKQKKKYIYEHYTHRKLAQKRGGGGGGGGKKRQCLGGKKKKKEKEKEKEQRGIAQGQFLSKNNVQFFPSVFSPKFRGGGGAGRGKKRQCLGGNTQVSLFIFLPLHQTKHTLKSFRSYFLFKVFHPPYFTFK